MDAAACTFSIVVSGDRRKSSPTITESWVGNDEGGFFGENTSARYRSEVVIEMASENGYDRVYRINAGATLFVAVGRKPTANDEIFQD